MAQHAHDTTAARATTGRRPGAAIPWAPDLAALVGMALVGFAISLYLTTVHYAHAPLLCSAGGVVNCAQVTTSAYSVVPGTQAPITIPGMLWFLVSGGLAVAAWRAEAHAGVAPIRLYVGQVGWGAIGLVTALYLVYVEIVRLHALCEWCTAVHVLTLLSFLVAVYRAQQRPDVTAADDRPD